MQELAEEMFGDWDYEYWLTIPEKFKETIMLKKSQKIPKNELKTALSRLKEYQED